jgi:hypothetical protein
MGTTKPGIHDALEDCRPVVDLNEVGWDSHPDHGFVPSIHFRHDRTGVDIAGRFCWLQVTLRLASEANLIPADFETGVRGE